MSDVVLGAGLMVGALIIFALFVLILSRWESKIEVKRVDNLPPLLPGELPYQPNEDDARFERYLHGHEDDPLRWN